MSILNSTSYRSILLLSICCLFSASAALGQTEEKAPNILIIMTDQQAWDAVGYAGNSAIKTPNLDRLANEGVNFRQAVTSCPVCVPARTSVYTGRLIETTTIRSNQDAILNDCYFSTFDEILVKRGYSAELSGKFHAPEHMARVYMNPPVEGMTGTEPIIDWEPVYNKYLQKNIKQRPLKDGELYEQTFYGGTIPYKLDPIDRRYQYLPSGVTPEDKFKSTKYGQQFVHGVLDLPAEYTITAVQGQGTIEAMERLKDKPFAITCSFHCPHVPITPSEPYASMYKPEEMIPPATVNDSRENSPYKGTDKTLPYPDKADVKYMMANYYAFVTEIDDWVGKILTKLDELKLADNTLVIFVSDHGEMLGSHGLLGKTNFYEESVRVPFVMRYPGKIKKAQTISTPVSILNIFPTVLDYAGVKNIASDGYSLRGLMEGTGEAKYDFAVSEWNWKFEDVPSIMIRTDRWKLMTTHRKGGGNVEALYDMKNDPLELNNLLGTNPKRFKHKKIVEKLKSDLLGYLKDVNSPLVEGISNRVMIRK